MNSVSKKKKGTNKFFTCCFRQADFDNESSIKQRGHKDGVGGPVFVPDRGEDEMVLRKILTSLSEENSKVSSDSGSGRSRRSFSGIVKAVLLKTSLVKKFSRKPRKKSSRNKSSVVSDKVKKASTATKVNPAPIKSPEADSSSWNPPNSSSIMTTLTSIRSSRSSSDRANSVELKQIDKPTSIEEARECSSPTIGLCVLLVCLLVLVFLGRVCAVLCTSTFLFLVRRRNKRLSSGDVPVNGVNLQVNDIDSDAYKKRVILGGLLERNRNRVVAPS